MCMCVFCRSWVFSLSWMRRVIFLKAQMKRCWKNSIVNILYVTHAFIIISLKINSYIMYPFKLWRSRSPILRVGHWKTLIHYRPSQCFSLLSYRNKPSLSLCVSLFLFLCRGISFTLNLVLQFISLESSIMLERYSMHIIVYLMANICTYIFILFWPFIGSSQFL